METRPLPLVAAGDGPGDLDEFRVSAAHEIAAVLRRLADASVPLLLASADGGAGTASVAATVWTTDPERGRLGLAVDVSAPGLNGVLEARDAVAVTYLDSIKLQFDLVHRVLVRGDFASVLNCAWPQALYRFQRRNAYRVRPLQRSAPVVRVRHSEIPEMQLALRVLDVSIGGCALFLPDDVPPLRPGVLLNQVEVELDGITRFRANLRLQHVSSAEADARGVRLGCEFVASDADATRALQRFIDSTQKRSRLLGQR